MEDEVKQERIPVRRGARNDQISLTKEDNLGIKSEYIAPVAQLDRAPGFEPVGRRFESCRARQ